MGNIYDKEYEIVEDLIDAYLCYILLSIGFDFFKHLINESLKNEREV